VEMIAMTKMRIIVKRYPLRTQGAIASISEPGDDPQDGTSRAAPPQQVTRSVCANPFV